MPITDQLFNQLKINTLLHFNYNIFSHFKPYSQFWNFIKIISLYSKTFGILGHFPTTFGPSSNSGYQISTIHIEIIHQVIVI